MAIPIIIPTDWYYAGLLKMPTAIMYFRRVMKTSKFVRSIRDSFREILPIDFIDDRSWF